MGSSHRLAAAAEGARGLAPGVPLRGSLRVPGSKSVGQRALLAAALAPGVSELRGLPDGADLAAARAWLSALGLVEAEGAARGAITIAGRGLPLRSSSGVAADLQAGESATLARCGTALLALCGTPGSQQCVTATGSLLARSHPALLDALGARVEARGWPTRLRACGPQPRGPALHLSSPSSSQEVSALLLALAAHPGPHTLVVEGQIPSRPYVDLTRSVLGEFGVSVTSRAHEGGESIEVSGPLVPATLDVEPDASLAAVALAAGCLSGGEVCALGLAADSAQGDRRIAEHLAAFGCSVDWQPEGLRASGQPTRGADLDLGGEPDLAPVLAVLAAAAATRGHASRLTGLGTLPGKESSRIEVLAEGLTACGWRVSGTADALHFEASSAASEAPSQGGAEALVLQPRGDHRMAFAFALAGLCRPGVRVAQPGCTAKSWPGFWDDLAGLTGLAGLAGPAGAPATES